MLVSLFYKWRGEEFFPWPPSDPVAAVPPLPSHQTGTNPTPSPSQTTFTQGHHAVTALKEPYLAHFQLFIFRFLFMNSLKVALCHS